MKSHTAMASRSPITENIRFAWGQSDQNQIKLKENQENVRPRETSCSSTTLELPAFRSHYNISNMFANNGTSAGFVAANTPVTAAGVESGGDMAGSVFDEAGGHGLFRPHWE